MSFDENLFFLSKTLFFTTKKSTFYKISKKYSKIRYYGTTLLVHKNMNFRAI